MLAWYVLYPGGQTVSDVIWYGPSTLQDCEDMAHLSALPDAHVVQLDSNKVEAHLAEDKRLADWLRERCI